MKYSSNFLIMAGSFNSFYHNLTQSFYHLNNAAETSQGLDVELENRLESLLSEFDALFEHLIKDKSDEEVELLDPPAVIPDQVRTFGEVIRYQRNKRGWTMQDLADMVDVNRISIAHYEANRYTPPATIYNKLLSVLELTPSGLLDQVPPPRTNTDRVGEMIDLLQELKDRL